jgi:hypothetical protein
VPHSASEPDLATRLYIDAEVRRIARDPSITDDVALREISRVTQPLTDWLLADQLRCLLHAAIEEEFN